MGWKNLPYWLKEGVITLVILIITFIISFIIYFFGASIYGDDVYTPYEIPLELIATLMPSV